MNFSPIWETMETRIVTKALGKSLLQVIQNRSGNRGSLSPEFCGLKTGEGPFNYFQPPTEMISPSVEHVESLKMLKRSGFRNSL